MKTMIFTVYDSAAQRYLEPFWSPTVEVAIREFRQVVNREGHQFNKFPEDYALFHVGEFDQELGILSSFESPRALGVALSFVNTTPQLKAVNDA